MRRRLEPVQRTADSPGASTVPQIVHDVLRSPGQSLNAAERESLGSRMGHDFSGVRVHTDSRAADSARSVGAAAYTFGGHVVFGEGKFQPGNADGRRLLAHELAHVIQQDESGAAGTPERLDQPQDASEEWADRRSRSALEGVDGAAVEAPASTVAPLVQRQTDPQAAPENSPGPAPAAAAAPGGGWTLGDTSVTFTISNQHISEASFLTAGGPPLSGAGFDTWTNPRVFSILTPERAWLRTSYQVDTREHSLPAQYSKFSVTNDIRFTTSSGQTTVDQHFQDDNPVYGGAGNILGTTLGFASAGARDLPILELPLNEGGLLTWSAGFKLPGGGTASYKTAATFQVRSETPAAPAPPAGPAAEGPAKAPGGAEENKPAAKGTPLPKSPPTRKAPPKLVGEIEALTEGIRRATQAAQKDPLVAALRDKLAEAQPFLPPGEAKKLIDEALASLVKDGVKSGIMTILEIIAGKSATTMPDTRNQTGPNVREGVPGTNIQKGPKIPWDIGVTPPPKLSFQYKNGLRGSYTAGEAMKFTVVPPDYFDRLQGNKRVVIVAAADAKTPNPEKRYGGPVPLETSASKEINLTAPSEPGKYVIRVDIGLSPDDSSIQEFEVTAAKK